MGSQNPTATPSMRPPSPIKPPTTSPTPNPVNLPSETPSSSPNACNNNPDYLYRNKKSCADIAAQKNRRILCQNNYFVQYNCRITCGLCCADDDTLRFRTKSGRFQKCNWLTLENGDIRKDRYCKWSERGPWNMCPS